MKKKSIFSHHAYSMQGNASPARCDLLLGLPEGYISTYDGWLFFDISPLNTLNVKSNRP